MMFFVKIRPGSVTDGAVPRPLERHDPDWIWVDAEVYVNISTAQITIWRSVQKIKGALFTTDEARNQPRKQQAKHIPDQPSRVRVGRYGGQVIHHQGLGSRFCSRIRAISPGQLKRTGIPTVPHPELV